MEQERGIKIITNGFNDGSLDMNKLAALLSVGSTYDSIYAPRHKNNPFILGEKYKVKEKPKPIKKFKRNKKKGF